MLGLLRTLWTQRQLVRGFVVRDLKSRYVGSTMGFFWSVVVPFLYLFVFMFVFSLVLKSRWTDQATPTDTALYMLVGILAWQAFAETLSRATNCLVENANLIQKVVFPSEILPAFLTASSLVNMLIGLPIVVVGVVVFLDQTPGASYVALPLLVLLQALFTLGLGYGLATLNLFLRDTFHLIGVLTLVWMFGTPVFYPAWQVQEASVPLPGTSEGVEVWVHEDGPRARVALDGEASFEIGADGASAGRWETRLPDDGEAELDPAVRRFLEAGLESRTGLADLEEIPDELDAYVTLQSRVHRRQVVEESERISLGFLLEINPMYWLIDSYRRVVLTGAWPEWRYVGRFAAVALIVFALGARFFARHKHRFPDLL